MDYGEIHEQKWTSAWISDKIYLSNEYGLKNEKRRDEIWTNPK